MSSVVLTILAGLLMLIGLVAVFVPIVPDLILIWLAALGYGLFVEWGRWGPWLFGGITALGLVGLLTELWVSGAGAKMRGASIWGVLGGLAAGLVGMVFFTPIGGLVGLLLGTFVVEYIRLGDARHALDAMLGMGVGFGASFFVKLVLGVAMVALWILWLVLP